MEQFEEGLKDRDREEMLQDKNPPPDASSLVPAIDVHKIP
jgi:hypothetical protein